MALNELSIQILKAIREEKTNERAIAEFLSIRGDRVHTCLEHLEQQGYIEGIKGRISFESADEYHDCWLTAKGNVMIDHSEDFRSMNREEFIRKILGAIHEGHTSEQDIASHLETEQYRVHSALANLKQESYIKGAESFSQRGELEYVVCTLTPQGQTMLNYPDDLSEQSRLHLQQEFNFSGSNIASVTGSGHIDNATINNYSPEQRQSLNEAAHEIQKLLNQLSQTYNPPNPLNNSRIATAGVEAIENNQALKSKIIKVLQVFSTEAFKELIDHPAVNILMACIEAWKDD